MTNETSAYNYVHPRFTWWLIPSSVWQTQLPPVCSPKCHILQHPVSNATSSCMLTQVSHVDLSTAPWDKHNFRLYAHTSIACWLINSPLGQTQLPPISSLSVTCFHCISSSLWQIQLPSICSPKCHMFPLHPQLPVTNTTSAYKLTQVSHVDLYVVLDFIMVLSILQLKYCSR